MANEAQPAPAAAKPKTGRSPAYPFISLKKALEQASALYQAEGKYAVPAPSAFRAWGYGGKSSGGRQTAAALKYYGLIDAEGEGDARKIKVSDRALRVLLDEREDKSERNAILRQLALLPAVYKKIIEQYPNGLPSDATVKHFLMFDQEYHKDAAADLLQQFKETAAFVGLFQPSGDIDISDGDNESDGDDREDPKGEDGRLNAADKHRKPPAGNQRSIAMHSGERELTTGLLAKDASFRLIVSGVIGVKEIETLIRKLEIDKDILADDPKATVTQSSNQ